MTARAVIAISLSIFAGLTGSALAAPETVTALQVTNFNGTPIGGRVGGLVWRGGLVLDGTTDEFGGLSSLSFTGPDGRLAMVSDRGNFVSGQLIYDEAGLPFGLVGVDISPMQNSKGAPLPRAFAQDAEGMDTLMRDGEPVAVRVSFENLTRVADFALTDGVPGGPAREIPIPDWISNLRTNESLESVCIAPPASPIAGSTLLIVEATDDSGNHPAWLLGHKDQGALSLSSVPGVNPTDCAFLPNGDLLVLERGTALLSFVMRLRRIPADQVRPGAVMTGEVLLSASGSDIDNMEGVAVHPAPDGETRITLMADNNFNDWERNLLLEFALPQ
ncbi:MAG TPA: esterase-like activity of phytase family protein [Devosiaceae bacterium]|jgi:hypothetical protein